MKIDLTKYIEEDCFRLLDVFRGADFIIEDEQSVRFTFEKENVYFFLSVEILTYLHTDKIVNVPWIKCTISHEANNKNKAHRMAQWLRVKFADKFSIMPFKDEDAYMLFFTNPIHNEGYFEMSFYMNPDYPNGITSNHVLDD